jgi:hypothetical protein
MVGLWSIRAVLSGAFLKSEAQPFANISLLRNNIARACWSSSFTATVRIEGQVLSQLLLTLEEAVVRTQLYCERPTLQECGEPDGVDLPLSEHLCGLDPSQCCVGQEEGLEVKNTLLSNGSG